MKLGETIYRLRTEKGMSQGDLADALEVSRQSVSKWETDSSVPELDKLVRLSQLFGVTLDELVTGEREKQEAPPPAPPEEAPKAPAKRPKRMTAGLALLGTGALVWLLLTVAFGGGGLLLGLIFALPCLLFAVICFVCRRDAGLWCAWAAFFCVDGFLYYATGISWRMVFWTLQYDPSWNYGRLATAWVLLGMAVILIFVTTVRLRKTPLQPTRDHLYYLIAGWALFIVINIPVPVSGEDWGLSPSGEMLFKLAEWVRMGVLTADLTYTVRYIRTKREEKTKS